MRCVEASIFVPSGPMPVWERIASADFCEAAVRALGGPGRLKREVSNSDDGKSLKVGTEIAFQKTNGRPWMRWRVEEFLPGKRLTLAASDHSLGLSSYDVTLEFRLESEEDCDRTKVMASLYVLLKNGVMELATLVLPVRWLYARGLRKLLSRLRADLGKPYFAGSEPPSPSS
ncbi:MAG: SRPBCC family protein [Elusimicrobia bacterium]|nr:SRPBCC family protein [Elusimicrobiota bacterium]